MALPRVTFLVSNGNNIAASNYLHFAANDERQTSCHWKQSQLRVTTAQGECKPGHQTFVAP